METYQKYQNILDNVLLKSGIVTLTGAKDNLGCHLITFQTPQQLLFTQLDYSSLIESLYVVIMYYKSPLVSFLVNMSHSTQIFIDHFIHVVDQLERKMSKNEIKRVYIIRPERKSIQKHFAKELGSMNKENKRINAQVVVIKAFDELYQYINAKNLTTEFSGTVIHDHNAWLAVQKMLTQYYVMVGYIATSSSDILQRIRGLSSGELVNRSPEKSTEHAQKKRLRNMERKKNEILRQYNFAKATEDGQRLRSYFQDPKSNESSQALSKSPVFDWDKALFQRYYRKMLTVNDSIEHAWKEGVDKMTSLITEQRLYDRMIESCTWIVDEGLPHLKSLPAQSKTLAEAVKQKINFENEFYKPVKMTLKKCRQTLKEVRQYKRSTRVSSDGLDMMADNFKSLMENLKTKTEERMERFRKEKDFMQTLNKAESWCDRASDILTAKQTTTVPQKSHHISAASLENSEKSLELFMERYPPLTRKELRHLLDYVENIDDLEQRNRARLQAHRVQELERALRISKTQIIDDSGEDLSSDVESLNGRNRSSYARNSSYQRRVDWEDSQTPFRSTIATDISTKRWHTPDDIMSSTTISNDDVNTSSPRATDLWRRPGDESSRLADIQRRLRDQELLYEQLILEEELRELAEQSGEEKSGLGQKDVGLGSSLNEPLENGNWSNNMANSGNFLIDFKKGNQEGRSKATIMTGTQAGLNHSSVECVSKYANTSEKASKTGRKTELYKHTELRTEQAGLTNRSSNSSRNLKVENWDSLVQPVGMSKHVFETGNMREPEETMELRNRKAALANHRSDSNRSFEVENCENLVKRPSYFGKGVKTVQTGEDDKKTGLKTDQVELTNVSCLSSKLLDGCNSLKRLAELENPLAVKGSTFSMFHQNDKNEKSQSGICNEDKKLDDEVFTQTKAPSNDLRDNVPSTANISSSSDGLAKLAACESPDVQRLKHHFKTPSHDGSDSSRESEKPSRDLGSLSFRCCSHGSEPHSRCYEINSPDQESCSPHLGSCTRDRENCSRDCMEEPRNLDSMSCDSSEKSREEILKTAREAVDHWTRLKNEQRGRLAQVIDDITTRKEIEEVYFNAQLQLCHARQKVAELSKSDNALRKFNLDNDVVNNSITSSCNTSSHFRNVGDQTRNSEGAFRKFVKDDAVVEKGRGDFEEGKEVLLDNEESLGITGGVDHDIEGSLDIEEIPSEKIRTAFEDRALKPENGDEVNSEDEQGSSDEFDDDVEEEELMLLCSQSSSSLVSQDELKNSLREEQDKLEEMFRQQKERLKKEREKIIEEEKRIEEWQKGKWELKGRRNGSPTFRRHSNSEGTSQNLIFDEETENNILDNIGDGEKLETASELHVGQDLKHKLQLSEHDKRKLQHDIPEMVQDISAPQHDEVDQIMHGWSRDSLAARHDLLEIQHATQKLAHDITVTQRDTRQPQHDIHKLSRDIAVPQQDLPQLKHNIPVSQLDLSRSPNEQTSSQHEQIQQNHEVHQALHGQPQVQHGSWPPQHENETTLHERLEGKGQLRRERKQLNEQNVFNELSNYDALRDKGGKKITSADVKLLLPIATDENFSAENDVEDLNDIVVSNIDSDEESRDKIEEELINILQDKTLEMEQENLKERDDEFGHSFPPLAVDGNPPCMSDNEDIDLMNQLIDDLMISDQEGANQDDCNEISVNTSQINRDHHRINMDNSGLTVDNSLLTAGIGRIREDNLPAGLDNFGISSSFYDGINEDNTRRDVDCGGTSEDDLGLDVDNVGINLNYGDGIKLQYEDQRIDVDTAEVNEDNAEISEDNEGLDVDDVGIHMDEHGINEDVIDLGDNFVVETSEDDFVVNVDNHEMNLDNITIGVDNRRTKGDTIGQGKHQILDDNEMRTESAANEELNEEFGIDVDFTIDLSKNTEGVEGTDLIDLLRGQSDAFSSQDSINVEEHTSDVESELPKTSKTQQNDHDLNEEHSGMSGYTKDQDGITKDQGGITKDQGGLTKDQDGITNGQGGITKCQDVVTKDEGEITQDQAGILGGHQLVLASDDNDSSDGDFGRVLEDIQEEESEYEDLMRYRGTQLDNNDNQVHDSTKIIVPSTPGPLTARISDHNMNKDNSANLSFTSSVIIDPGTGCCKAGFSIDDQPRVIIPSVVGKRRTKVGYSERYKEYYVGEEAKHLRQVLDLQRPLKNGLVQDWDLMEKLLDEVYEELRCESDQYPVLLSEPVLNPKSNREEMIQVMFESFHVPATYTCAQATLSLFATGRTTGLVYDCGYTKAHCVPVYEGYALPHATTTTELAGLELTTCLSRMLRDRGVSLEGQAGLDVAEDIKEKLCYVVMDYDSERKAYNTGERNDTTYTMPDGQTIAIGSERFRCPEVLFTPSIVGMATDGAQEIIYKTALQCAIDVRPSLYENIVISGGSTMFPGFSRRLHLELCKLLGTRSPGSINIDAVDDRNVLTWQGGAMLSKLSNFTSMWITSSEYDEFGPGIVHKKCV